MKFKSFGEELGAILKKNNFSCSYLGVKIGVPTNRISDIVRDKRGVTPDTAYRLDVAFETPLGYHMQRYSAYEMISFLEEKANKGEIDRHAVECAIDNSAIKADHIIIAEP